MNRQIRFRAWNYCHLRGVFIMENYDKIKGNCLKFVTEPEKYKDLIIMQQTPFKDSEGIDIYEGDIVKDWVSGAIFEIVFTDYGNFGMKSKMPVLKDLEYETIDPSFASTTLIVVGNIHQNHELLKTI